MVLLISCYSNTTFIPIAPTTVTITTTVTTTTPITPAMHYYYSHTISRTADVWAKEVIAQWQQQQQAASDAGTLNKVRYCIL